MVTHLVVFFSSPFSPPFSFRFSLSLRLLFSPETQRQSYRRRHPNPFHLLRTDFPPHAFPPRQFPPPASPAQCGIPVSVGALDMSVHEQTHVTRLATSPSACLGCRGGVKENGEHVTARSHGSADQNDREVPRVLPRRPGPTGCCSWRRPDPEQSGFKWTGRVRARVCVYGPGGFGVAAASAHVAQHVTPCLPGCFSPPPPPRRHITGNKCAYTITNSLLS